MKREIIVRFSKEYDATEKAQSLSVEESAQFIKDKLNYAFPSEIDGTPDIDVVSAEDIRERNMLTVRSFKKGDVVYILTEYDGYRRNNMPIAPEWATATVVSAGRKYVKTSNGHQFEGLGDYYLQEFSNERPKLFRTKDDMADYLEHKELKKWLGSINFRDIEQFSLEQLRKVRKILETE